MLGNGVVGILSEMCNKWERRAPLTPAHCARLLHSGKGNAGVARIIVQPSTKRIYHDALYEEVGCEVSEDLTDCGLIVGVKQPKLEMILPDRGYAFFSHTHKAQKENMPLLDKILAERATLYDYELIVGDHGKRLLAFGIYAGRAGMVDFLHGLGQRYLSYGYSTPFLSLGSSYMYPSLAAAKAAVISVGEEISTLGLPSGICPLVFVFTGTGNVSQGAQEIFKLLPHTFVDPSRLPELFETAGSQNQHSRVMKRNYQVYGCVVTSKDMVEPKDPNRTFNKADYYSHPEHYTPIFHEKIAPYASVIVNCMYWERRFPRLLTNKQLQDIMNKRCPLVGIADITCDIGGSIEFVNQDTTIDSPFFRFDPSMESYHYDMEGSGVICSAVDILPTEFAKEASQHFGNILSQFVGYLASTKDLMELPPHLKQACITHRGALTSLYEYIPRMRESATDELSHPNKKIHTQLVSLSGHLFDDFLINEALDKIEAAGGSFRLVKCHVGQSTDVTSYSELEVGADDRSVLDQIIDSLTSLAGKSGTHGIMEKQPNRIAHTVGKIHENGLENGDETRKKTSVLILGAGRVCRPAAELLTSTKSLSSSPLFENCMDSDFDVADDIQVIVASLYLREAEEVIQGIPNATAVQLDVSDQESLHKLVSQVEVVISLLPPSCHVVIAMACIELRKHLVTASYVNDSLLKLGENAKDAGITVLGEMGLDPGIDHMMAMKMIDQAHDQGGKVRSFTSYCGGLPSPAAANNPLAYKFSWNPAGALRAGRNPATYRSHGEVIQVSGDNLYDSAVRFRLPEFPAFALEVLPNRDSLIYGDIYRIGDEASTIFRGTLRYEGFSEIMGTLARIGFFDTESQGTLTSPERPTFESFTLELLDVEKETLSGSVIREIDIAEKIISLGHCKQKTTALKTARTILFLGLIEQKLIPSTCKTAFDVTCLRMEEKLAYSGTEQDMALLYHEIEVEFPESREMEKHQAILLGFGKTEKGRTISAMALTVGVPAAIGALLLLANKIKTRGILRPIEPEVYVPALDIMQAYGITLLEKRE
ncbi:alpha-aminoadipic semialdehyde synthase isoform X1 [Beta vulgaris subsp. vulgaris]|uniref:alpha-aminoadipic semialdehyde synthase isoform X1 n=1 Tax=Beta vulgaris subsp. vulgaris TaxID=3555 RepID=UPI002036CDC7|nr:alpha-aminoadipic semialdehyde synthase isoform X1 [Beta vulgaris subsp. vulgaris]